MYVMDLVLYCLGTFLWWIIWNTTFSIARSFMLGLSIWTPWKDIYTRLPKRIYSKILATADMETKYKPKVGHTMPQSVHANAPFAGPRLADLERNHHLDGPRAPVVH